MQCREEEGLKEKCAPFRPKRPWREDDGTLRWWERIQLAEHISSLGFESLMGWGGAEDTLRVRWEQKHFFLFFFFIIDTVTNVHISPTLPTSTHSLPPFFSGHHHTVVCVDRLFIYVLWLIPSPSLIQNSLPTPLWQLSVCSTYSYLWFYFVRRLFCWLDFTNKSYCISLSLTGLFHLV